MLRFLALLTAAAMVAGCAASPQSRSQPANDATRPEAAEAAVRVPESIGLEPAPQVIMDDAASTPSANQSMHDMHMPAGMKMDGADASATQPNAPGHEMNATTHEHSHPGAATQSTAAKELYICPMHPQIVSDHPGKCPICSMTLVRKGGGK